MDTMTLYHAFSDFDSSILRRLGSKDQAFA